MKYYLSFLMLLAFISIKAQELTTTNKLSQLETPGKESVAWESVLIDMGEVKYHNPQTASFVFTNTGDKPVIVTSARGSCGCTNVQYPKEPIRPGEKGTIQATYDAANLGAFNKSVTVDINIPDGRQVLRFKGTVVN